MARADGFAPGWQAHHPSQRFPERTRAPYTSYNRKRPIRNRLDGGILRWEGVPLELLPPRRGCVVGAASRGVYICPGMHMPGETRRERLADVNDLPCQERLCQVRQTSWGRGIYDFGEGGRLGGISEVLSRRGPFGWDFVA